MDCDGAAFTEGDRVIVQFDGQQQEGATVIGFEREPKICDAWRSGFARVQHGNADFLWIMSQEELEGWTDAAENGTVKCDVRFPGGGWTNIPYIGFNGQFAFSFQRPGDTPPTIRIEPFSIAIGQSIPGCFFRLANMADGQYELRLEASGSGYTKIRERRMILERGRWINQLEAECDAPIRNLTLEYAILDAVEVLIDMDSGQRYPPPPPEDEEE